MLRLKRDGGRHARPNWDVRAAVIATVFLFAAWILFCIVLASWLSNVLPRPGLHPQPPP